MGAEPDLLAIQQAQARLFRTSILCTVVQLIAFCTMVAALGKEQTAIGKALSTGLKATPTTLIACVFLTVGTVGLYLAMILAFIPLILLVAAFGGFANGSSEALAGPAAGVALIMMAAMFFMMIYLFARFVTLLPVVVLERTFNPFRAIRRSWQMTRGHTLKLAGFIIAQWIIVMVVYFAVAGTLAPSIGAPLLAGQMPSVGQLATLGAAMALFAIASRIFAAAAIAATYGQLAADPSAEAATAEPAT